MKNIVRMIIRNAPEVLWDRFFGYEVTGIYQSQEEIDNREVKQYLGDVRPGDLMIQGSEWR